MYSSTNPRTTNRHGVARRLSPRHLSSPRSSRVTGADRPHIGVISNANAGSVRRVGASDEELSAGLSATAVRFGDPGELSAAIARLQRAGVSVLAVNGGDGTLSAVLTELRHRWRGPLPVLAPLCGGSYNSTARALGAVPAEGVHAQLTAITRGLSGEQSSYRTVDLQTVRVDDPNRPRTAYGFLFANGFVHDYVRYIESIGGTTGWWSLVGALLVTGGALLNTGEARRIWADQSAQIEIDGRAEHFGTFKTAIACGAIFLPAALTPLPQNRSTRSGQFVYLVNGMARRDLLWSALPILRGVVSDPAHRTGFASHLNIRSDGGYVLDGERFGQTASQSLSVRAGGTVRCLSLRDEGTSRRELGEGRS